MGNDMYHPSNNYERNFLLVKKFGGKPVIIIIPILLFLHVLGIGYLSITKNEPLEVTLLKLVTSKISPDLGVEMLESTFMILSSLAALIFIFVFLSFFFSSRDPSYEASPDISLSVSYALSMLQLVFFSLCFVFAAFFLVLFAFKKPEFFEEIGKLFNVTVSQISAYKVTILLATALVCVVLIIMIWYSQTQTEFVKSLRLTLVNSVARNTGAHTYGVFSISISVALLFVAGGMTFFYYCYKDAFSGFGINLEPMYIYVSLALAYIRGLVPFCISVAAMRYSEMVDEANTMGTIYYNDVDTIGAVQDPNMARIMKNSRRKNQIP